MQSTKRSKARLFSGAICIAYTYLCVRYCPPAGHLKASEGGLKAYVQLPWLFVVLFVLFTALSSVQLK